MEKRSMRVIINALQIAYVVMIFFNGTGQLNMVVEDLGFIVWILIPILSLILCIWYFCKTKNKDIIMLAIFSILEISFYIFIWCLPYFVGIPFD